MALNNVANAPLLLNLTNALSSLSAFIKTVPVKVWRTIVMVLVLFWIVNSLISLFWALIPSPNLPVPKVVPIATQSKLSDNRQTIDLAALKELNILGNSEEVNNTDNTEAVEVPEDKPLAKTKLNLALQGVISGEEGGSSWAIIGKSDAQKLYTIDDRVEGVSGVKIAKVLATKVILDNNGELEELWLYGKDGKNIGSPAAPRRSRKAVSQPEPEKEEDTLRAEVSREEVMSVKSIGDVVRFMVATEDGKMIGYKVRPGRKRKLFDQVGLKTDDIVVSVNGIEVNEPQKVREVYQALKNATEADLEVMRDGNSHSIHISMSPEG